MRDDENQESERDRRGIATSRGERGAERALSTPLPPKVEVELATERSGVLGYRYRRLRIEIAGKRASVKELKLQLDYDLQFDLATRRRDLLKQRGRRIDAHEAEELWRSLERFGFFGLPDKHDFLDSVNPEELDETIGADGEPISVSTGEEGPACLTVRWERDGAVSSKRLVVERFREPDAAEAEARRARVAPLAAVFALVDARIKATRELNYRKIDLYEALAEELRTLKARDFLNLHQIERRAVEALGAVGDARAVPFLASELWAPDSRVRLQALDALAAIGHADAVPEIELLYYDDEGPVREKARRILKALETR